MIKNIFILSILVLGVSGWTIYSDKKSAPINKTQEIMAQDFDFIDIQNQAHTLYDYKGRRVILHFWATWCAPCLKELPDLVALAARHPSKLNIIAIAVADNKNDIDAFIHKTKLTIPSNMVIGLDPDKQISADIYNSVKLPESFIFTHRLSLVEKIIGAHEGWSEYDIR